MRLHTYHFIIFLIVLSFLVLFSCTRNSRKNSDKPDAHEFENERIPGEYLVTVKKGIDEEYLHRIFAANDVKTIKKIAATLYLVKFEYDPGPLKIYENYIKDENIENIQPNFIYEAVTERKKMSKE